MNEELNDETIQWLTVRLLGKAIPVIKLNENNDKKRKK